LATSVGPSCIRLNQSAIRPQRQQLPKIKQEHKDIFSKVQNHLVEHYHIPRTQAIYEEYSEHLVNYISDSYLSPLSYRDKLVTLEQAQFV